MKKEKGSLCITLSSEIDWHYTNHLEINFMAR